MPKGLSHHKIEVLLVEPPPVSKFGELRTLGSIGALKANMRWPPLDLMIIAGFLKKYGINSRIVDANSLRMNFSRVGEIVKETKPKLVLFTTSTPTFYHDLQIADLVKSVSPRILTAVTSTHINAQPDEALRLNSNVDFAIPQEPEVPFLKLIQEGYHPVGLKGIVYRKGKEIIQNGTPEPCENLDELGIPAHDLIPLEIYQDPFTKYRPITVTYAGRGCVNHPPCIMCSACFYPKERYRSVEILLQEMLWLQKSGVKEIRFPFESGFNNIPLATELFDRMVKEKVRLRFTCNGRADHLAPELLEKMAGAGCSAVNIGCESSDSEILNSARKNITTEQVADAVRNAKKAGLQVLVYFMFGLPGETGKTMEETLRFAKHLGADLVTFGIAIPHPGTFFYRYLESNGYLTTKDWSRYNPMFPPPYSYPHLSGAEIYAFTRRAYRSFYFHPSFIASRLFKANLKDNFRNFIGFGQRYGGIKYEGHPAYKPFPKSHT